MPDNLWQSYLESLGMGPMGPRATPSYGIGPGVLGMGDPMGITGMPYALSMGYPAVASPSLTPNQEGNAAGVSTAALMPPSNTGSFVAQNAAPTIIPQPGQLGALGPPARPVTPTPASAMASAPPPLPPPRPTSVGALAPAIPPPRPKAKGRIDPKTVDLGMNKRFIPIQYQVPSGRGPLGNNPIYTALNLGGQS